MIHRLLDKLTHKLVKNDAILLLAAYEKAGLEWMKRADVIHGIGTFAAADTKCTKLSTNRLESLGFFECEVRAEEKFARCKWVRVTEEGRKFLNQCYKHAQGKKVLP
jgi:DNA-binding MarR family transcriptional regulator